MPSAARRLARFVTDLGLKDVPAPVVRRAGLLALDTLGCCLAASKYDFARAVRATAERLGGPAESRLGESSLGVGPGKAAVANPTRAQGPACLSKPGGATRHPGSVP